MNMILYVLFLKNEHDFICFIFEKITLYFLFCDELNLKKTYDIEPRHFGYLKSLKNIPQAHSRKKKKNSFE